MKTNPKLAVVVIVFTLLSMAFYKEPRADARVFCAYDRVFIEFEEDGKVWGTLWLDDDGRPVNCQSNTVLKTKKSIRLIDT